MKVRDLLRVKVVGKISMSVSEYRKKKQLYGQQVPWKTNEFKYAVKGKGVACARYLQFVLLNYLVKAKTIERKCSRLNDCNFGVTGPIWTMF